MDDKIPEEVFIGVKHDVGHLRIFGFLVYFHSLKDKRNKLEALGKKATFVGYCENSKTFRIYVPDQRNIEFSRDGKFDEDATLGKPRNNPPPPPSNVDVDLLECPSILEPENDVVDDPLEPMDPLDPP